MTGGVARAIFGAYGQLAVGILLMAATITETVWWLWFSVPTTKVVFIVSMEALAFAAFNQIGNALGYRATERVEAKVVENIEQADEVTVES